MAERTKISSVLTKTAAAVNQARQAGQVKSAVSKTIAKAKKGTAPQPKAQAGMAFAFLILGGGLIAAFFLNRGGRGDY